MAFSTHMGASTSCSFGFALSASRFQEEKVLSCVLLSTIAKNVFISDEVSNMDPEFLSISTN